MDAVSVAQLKLAFEVLADQAADDLQPETLLARARRIEVRRQPAPIVVNLDVQAVALFGQSNYDTPTWQADKGVLDRVLNQLVDDQRARRRLLGWQRKAADAFERQADRAAVIEHTGSNFGEDAVGHLVDVDGARFLVAEELVHHRDRDDSADALAQLLGNLRVARAARLQAQQRGDGLQVVLDAVVDLLDHRRLDLELLLFLEFVGDVLDRDDGAGWHAA